jgi:hypothetical protein
MHSHRTICKYLLTPKIVRYGWLAVVAGLEEKPIEDAHLVMLGLQSGSFCDCAARSARILTIVQLTYAFSAWMAQTVVIRSIHPTIIALVARVNLV